MRKYLLALLVGVAAPALAAADPGDNNHRWQHRDSAQQSKSEDRGERGDRAAVNTDRPHFNRSGGSEQSQPAMRVESNNDRPHFNRTGGGEQSQPVMQVESNNGGSGERRFHNGIPSRFSSGREQSSIQPTRVDQGGSSDSVRNWRREERQRINSGPKIVTPTEVMATPTLRQNDRELPRVLRNRVPIVSDTPREGTQPRLRTGTRRLETTNWSTRWRTDHRYDWRTHRRHHHSLFHLGIYYDPFGWNYRSYQIGWRLWPSYYSSRYWINDPWQYRLPYAPPGYRWVRYWDDALLVDTWTGQVVDVIYNFFW